MWLSGTQDKILISKARLAFPGLGSNAGGEALLWDGLWEPGIKPM